MLEGIQRIQTIHPEAGAVKVPINVLGRLTDEHYHGPQEFEMIVDYNLFFEHLRDNEVPPEKRWTNRESLGENAARVEIVSFTKPENRRPAKALTEYANLPGRPWENSRIRAGYQTFLNEIYWPLVTDIQSRKDAGEEIIGIAVLNGGLLTQEYYNLPPEARGQIEEKRLDYEEEGQRGLALGISNLRLPKAIEEFTGQETLLVYEDCTATGISGMGFLHHLKNSQKKQGLQFGKIEFHFAVATQQGIQNILKRADELMIEIVIKSGEVVYALNENFYLTRTSEETDLNGQVYQGTEVVVGDMGAFGAALPYKYNDGCPWNRNRHDRRLD